MVPQDAELTRRHDEIPAWDDMDAALKPILARQMENYAGFLEHTDHHVGRLLDAIAELGILDDTLVFLIIGDNGASAEGTPQGTFNEMISLNGMGALETPEFMAERLDQWGGPASAPHYAVGWAHAICTLYQWTKQVAPTILEAAGLPEPAQVNGITQKPLEGTSMAYSFDDTDAADRHQTQYFEIFGNRRIYRFGYEYTDVGRDALSPVTADYPPGDTAFTGTIKLIELESGDDSHDHLIDPARLIHFIMAKQ
jgi:arylsulfatase A-like enzyme